MLSVIILTYNEELHIRRCIQSIKSLASEVIVVDSYSADNTVQIAEELGATVYQRAFKNQADQFQWAIDNCPINTEWILRLDADETIGEDLAKNIGAYLESDGNGSNGAIFNRRQIFLGRWVRYGGRYPLPMLRLFRRGTAHVEQKWMDEHIVLDDGQSITLDGEFCDDNLNSVSWFVDKHNKYATREMVDIILSRIYPQYSRKISEGTGFSIRFKRLLKENIYLKLPYFVRPFLYFLYRYIFQLGFLDGASGFAYHFMQGFWYRALVDLKCLEAEKLIKNCQLRSEKIEALENLTGLSLEDAL